MTLTPRGEPSPFFDDANTATTACLRCISTAARGDPRGRSAASVWTRPRLRSRRPSEYGTRAQTIALKVPVAPAALPLLAADWPVPGPLGRNAVKQPDRAPWRARRDAQLGMQSACVFALGIGGLFTESGGVSDAFGQVLRESLTAYYRS
jgi:hypothetical protein